MGSSILDFYLFLASGLPNLPSFPFLDSSSFPFLTKAMKSNCIM